MIVNEWLLYDSLVWVREGCEVCNVVVNLFWCEGEGVLLWGGVFVDCEEEGKE